MESKGSDAERCNGQDWIRREPRLHCQLREKTRKSRGPHTTIGEALCLLLQRRSHPVVVKRAGYAMAALLQDVGVDHGGGQIIMSQQGLNGADVRAALEKVGARFWFAPDGIAAAASRCPERL